MKKYLIISILAITILLAGCTSKRAADNTEKQELLNKVNNLQAKVNSLENTSVAPAPAVTSTETVADANQKIIYQNDKYGFSLSLPKEWAKFKANESEGDINSGSVWNKNIPTKVVDISFSLPETIGPLPSQLIKIFSITIYSKAQWQELIRLGSLVANFPNLGEYHGQEYILDYEPQEYVNEYITSRNEEVALIKTTFKFTK